MKTIPNFSKYFVDDKGNIYSKNYKRTGKAKMLKPALDGSGYLRTMILSDDGKYKTIKVHRIVALAYYGESDLEVNHKDGDKTNNNPNNLEYVTRSENLKHAYKSGLLKTKRGCENGNSKLNESAVRAIRKKARESGRYYGRKELAEKYGVSEANIKDIVNNRIWKHI